LKHPEEEVTGIDFFKCCVRLVLCLRIILNNKYLLHRFKGVIEPAKNMKAVSETQQLGQEYRLRKLWCFGGLAVYFLG
jgi:hypothetical protein